MNEQSVRLQFRSELNTLQAPPPWTVDPDEPGRILDANGKNVLMIAIPLSDMDILKLSAAVLTAVNTCADFIATYPPEEPGP